MQSNENKGDDAKDINTNTLFGCGFLPLVPVLFSFLSNEEIVRVSTCRKNFPTSLEQCIARYSIWSARSVFRDDGMLLQRAMQYRTTLRGLSGVTKHKRLHLHQLEGLRELYFNNSFNQPLTEGMLPGALTHLTFGDAFDQPLEGVLPGTLTHLTFADVSECQATHPLSAAG